MARRRSSKRVRAARAAKANKFRNFMATAVGAFAFYDQLTIKDYQPQTVQTAYVQQNGLLGWFKQTSNIVGGRLFGINPFGGPGGAPTVLKSFNIWNGINKYSIGGLLTAALYKHIPGAPHKSAVAKAAGAAALGGFVGGVFDDPVTSNVGAPPTSFNGATFTPSNLLPTVGNPYAPRT